MPTLTRWFIKIALVYLVAALLLGLLPAFGGLMDLPDWFGALSPVYFHLFMVGWVTQLIIGVAYWMFPKYSSERPHRNEQLAWATFWLINVGLLLRVVCEPLNNQTPNAAWGWLLVLSALVQWAGGLAFCVNTWGRVK